MDRASDVQLPGGFLSSRTRGSEPSSVGERQPATCNPERGTPRQHHPDLLRRPRWPRRLSLGAAWAASSMKVTFPSPSPAPARPLLTVGSFSQHAAMRRRAPSPNLPASMAADAAVGRRSLTRRSGDADGGGSIQPPFPDHARLRAVLRTPLKLPELARDQLAGNRFHLKPDLRFLQRRSENRSPTSAYGIRYVRGERDGALQRHTGRDGRMDVHGRRRAGHGRYGEDRDSRRRRQHRPERRERNPADVRKPSGAPIEQLRVPAWRGDRQGRPSGRVYIPPA